MLLAESRINTRTCAHHQTKSVIPVSSSLHSPMQPFCDCLDCCPNCVSKRHPFSDSKVSQYHQSMPSYLHRKFYQNQLIPILPAEICLCCVVWYGAHCQWHPMLMPLIPSRNTVRKHGSRLNGHNIVHNIYGYCQPNSLLLLTQGTSVSRVVSRSSSCNGTHASAAALEAGKKRFEIPMSNSL